MGKAKLKPVKADLSLRESVTTSQEFRPIIEKTGRGNLLCYEAVGGRWFRSSETEVMRVVDNLNHMIQNDIMAIQVNDWLQLLGLYVTGQFNGYELRAIDIPPWTDLFIADLRIEGYKYFKDEPVLVINVSTKPVKRYSEEV